MNSIQCLDGLGGALTFDWLGVPSHYREYLDRAKLLNSYTGRAAKAVVNAIDTATPLAGKDVMTMPSLFKDALAQIRIGLEPIELATKEYQAAKVTYEHLLGMREHVDALLGLLGVDAARIIAEAREQVIRPDALDGVVSKTVNCAKVSFKSHRHYTSQQYEGLLIAELTMMNLVHHSDLSSITRPHRLKNFLINTHEKKIMVVKPTLYFAWGDHYSTTICLGKPVAVKVTGGGGLFQAMRIKRGCWWGDKQNEDFRVSMKIAEDLLTKADGLDLVRHSYG